MSNTSTEITAASCVAVLLIGITCGWLLDTHCNPQPKPSVTVVEKWDTLPAPPPVHDTIQKPKWVHDTIHDTVGKVVSNYYGSCETIDTMLEGARVGFQQCFLLSDSALHKAAQPPILNLRLPPPVVRESTITITEVVYKNKPVCLPWEIIKDVGCFGVGVFIGKK